LEPLAKESKSVPHFRCYASPPRTETYAPLVAKLIASRKVAKIPFLNIKRGL